MANRNKRQSIHNNFFQQVFSNPDNLTDFLQAILPPDVTELLDFSWIALDQQEYIQTDLGCNAADLVAHLPTRDGKGLDIYFLLEHKSWLDNRTWLQVLHYQQLMWRKDLQEKQPLRPIIPVVLYHGKRPWKLPDNFAGQFSLPQALNPFIPNYRWLFVDLSRWDTPAAAPPGIRSNIFLITALFLMKHAYNMDLQKAGRILALWKEMGIWAYQKQTPKEVPGIYFLYQYLALKGAFQ